MALGASVRLVDNDSDADAENLNSLERGLNVYHSPTGGLFIRVTAGTVIRQGPSAPARIDFAEVTSDQAVTGTATNYVYLDQAGALTINTSGFPEAPHIPLAEVATSSTTVQTVTDRRPVVYLPGATDPRLWRAGRLYTNLRAAPTTTVTLTADTLYGIPFDVHGDQPVDRLGVEVTTADAGSQIRLGLYRESLTTRGEPGTLLEDLGTISSATTGMKLLAVSPTRRLQPGRYFCALIASSAVVAFRAHAAGAAELGWPGGTSDLQAASLEAVWRGTGGGNDEATALPDPFPSSPTAVLTAYPAPVMRAA